MAGWPSYLYNFGLIGNFRLEYENEIEYKYEFLNTICRFYIVTSHTNLIPEAAFFTKVALILNLLLVVQSKGCYYSLI